MAESLYTTQTPGPGLDDLSDLGIDGVGGATATTMIFAVDGQVTHVRFFSTVTVSGTYTAELWQVTDDTSGTRLAAKVVAAAAVSSAGWNTIAFDTPVDVTAGVAYRSALHNSNGNYVARSGVFGSGDLVNGNITAPQSGSSPNPPNVGALRNGNFRTDSAANAYPNGNGNGSSYLVDVVFEAGGEPVERQVSGTFALGTVAFTGTVQRGRRVTGTFSLGTVAFTGTVGRTAGAGRVAGGWRSLLDIMRDARDTRDRAEMAQPSSCPRCTEPLRAAPDGGVFCPWDGWRPT